VSEKSWTSITINFIVKLSSLRDSVTEVVYDVILTIVKQLMKYVLFILFSEKITAQELAHTILREVVSRFKLSEEIIFNKDKLFMSKFWQTLTAELRIATKLLTAYHLQTDEQTEWINQTKKMYLWHYVNE